jgi:hypothetical protein
MSQDLMDGMNSNSIKNPHKGKSKFQMARATGNGTNARVNTFDNRHVNIQKSPNIGQGKILEQDHRKNS